MSWSDTKKWQWENATAGAVAGFATTATLHPLDVVRTRFQVNDGRITNIPLYKNTVQAIYTIAKTEGLKGIYAGIFPAVLGSTISWSLYFFFYNKAKNRHSKGGEKKLTAGLHLLSAAEAGALVSLFTNPVWLVKTRLQLQTPLHQSRPYSGFNGLILVSHGAIQFTVYEELRQLLVGYKSKRKTNDLAGDESLNSVDYAMLGGCSKFSAMLFTYPYQVIRARLQQRPSNGIQKYKDSWHVLKDTVRFEGFRGFYKGITPNLLKNVPASSITFVVYENVLRLLKRSTSED
ncbi:Folate transporter 1 [Ranunculus cassubicifolius]